MPVTVELVSPVDTIVFYPEPSVNGWVYNNDTLDAWYDAPDSDPKTAKRPNANGSYGLGQVFTKEHYPVVSGQYFGTSSADALDARDRLVAMRNDGNSITMRVTDERGTTRRTVWLLERHAPFRYDFAHFPFDLALVAPDPLRYAAEQSSSQGMPSAGTGLVWNLGTSGTGLFWDWGSAGVLGQVSFTNTGKETTFPRIEVGGAGGFAAGFRVTEIETGREITVNRVTNTGDVIVLDSRTERAYLDSGDVTGTLSSRDWFEIPAGATRRYQVNPLGAVSGSPTITIYASPAYL